MSEYRLIEFRSENFKGLKAVYFRPKGAVTTILGPNGAGKSSILDAIESALAGAKASPPIPIRHGELRAEVVLDLGDITVRRVWNASGKTTLDVLSKEGAKYPSPQAVLDKLFDGIAFDPLAFDGQKPAEQAAQLAKIAGIDLAEFSTRRKLLEGERALANRIAKEAKIRADGMKVDADAPTEMVDTQAAWAELQQADEANRLAEAATNDLLACERSVDAGRMDIERKNDDITKLKDELARRMEVAQSVLDRSMLALRKQEKQLAKYQLASSEAVRVDTKPIREKLKDADHLNAKFRAVEARTKAIEEAEGKAKAAAILEGKITALDLERDEKIASANLPVPGLSLTEHGVALNGTPLVQCSTAERLRTSVAIGLAANSKLKIMMIHDGSLLDADGRRILAEMAEAADAQVFLEVVERPGEVGIRIHDGEIVPDASAETPSMFDPLDGLTQPE